MFSVKNLRLVSGSNHTFCTGAAELASSCSLRASYHSRVTGGSPAILRFRLYLGGGGGVWRALKLACVGAPRLAPTASRRRDQELEWTLPPVEVAPIVLC